MIDLDRLLDPPQPTSVTAATAMVRAATATAVAKRCRPRCRAGVDELGTRASLPGCRRAPDGGRPAQPGRNSQAAAPAADSTAGGTTEGAGATPCKLTSTHCRSSAY